MASLNEIIALQSMAGSYGCDLVANTNKYTAPAGLCIRSIVIMTAAVIASAEEVVEGGVAAVAGEAWLTPASLVAATVITLPDPKPLISITLTSGSVMLYFGRLDVEILATATATAAGLTTGAIAATTRRLKVISPSADSVCCLPTTGAGTVGMTIFGEVGDNGFELRPIAAQAATVYINGVTTNVEAAIPAQSSFEIRCIDATHWILRAWDIRGNERAAIVPDAA